MAITFTSGFILTNLFISRRLRPRTAWYYVAGVSVVFACWRWVVVLLGMPELWPDVWVAIDIWIQPITQSVSILVGISLLLLAIVYSRRRNGE